jgi:hypothetical protein
MHDKLAEKERESRRGRSKLKIGEWGGWRPLFRSTASSGGSVAVNHALRTSSLGNGANWEELGRRQSSSSG